MIGLTEKPFPRVPAEKICFLLFHSSLNLAFVYSAEYFKHLFVMNVFGFANKNILLEK